MALLGILKKKCAYCHEAVNDEPVWKNVKLPGRTGTFKKPFCSEEHAALFQQEVSNRKSHGGGGGCCH